ncbi:MULTISPECIES: hypothetical protein [unclassified Endozoicomonas]|uniref:hypothetical protein n=1 Tax=unclassified Endozoicomonas TaxID=2644528 RepID=UPI0021478E3F|nr:MULTISPECIES: hypothetical protein [unclassified Endozoicomonas]
MKFAPASSILPLRQPECKDRIIKHPLYAKHLLLLFLLLSSVVCQAEPLTGRFMIEPGSGLPPDDKRHRVSSYRVNRVAYELILTARNVHLSSVLFSCYSRLTIEIVVLVSWLMLTKGDCPFVTTTMMAASGDNPPQDPASGSSCQGTPGTTCYSTRFFTCLERSGSGGDNRDPQRHSHTLGLNCFVHPCYGVCQFRPSGATSIDPEIAAHPQPISPLQIGIDIADIQPPWNFDSPTNSENHLNDTAMDEIEIPENFSFTSDDFAQIDEWLDPEKPFEEIEASLTLSHSETQQTATESTRLCQGQPHLSQPDAIQATEHSGQRACKVTVVGGNGQPQPCGKVFKNAQTLATHKYQYHSGQQTCEVKIVSQGGRAQTCGQIFKNIKALSAHKNQYHTGPRVCDVILVGVHVPPRPCGKAYKSALALSVHKRQCHTGQRICDVILVGKDGQRRPCGKVYKNVQCLSAHKSQYHTEQRVCDVSVVSGHGQPRPCGKVCKNVQALSNHKRKEHTAQQTCGATVAGKDGQPRPCGKVCKNSKVLSAHKSKCHTGQRVCDVTLVSEDGQPRPCGKLCRNGQALSDHKRTHRKRKPVDAGQNNGFCPEKGKMNQ